MKPVLLLTLPLLMAACTPSTPESAPAASTEAAAPAAPTPPEAPATPAAPAPDALPKYEWRLESATDASGARIDALFANADKPVQLRFAEGRLQVSNTCNTMMGRYEASADSLDLGPLASTMRACVDPKLAALDEAVSARLQGKVGYALETAGPALVLTTASGDVLRFSGTPTPETEFGGPGQTVFLEVDAQTKPCSHPLMPNYQCLQVREVSFDDAGKMTRVDEQWQNRYEAIRGYEHPEGVRQVIRVKRYTRANPPADASSQVDVLDMVVRSENVKP